MDGLTFRQREVLGVISEFIRENGYAPSVREIMPAVRVRSVRGVTTHIDALERKGMLERARNDHGGAVARGLRLLPRGIAALRAWGEGEGRGDGERGRVGEGESRRGGDGGMGVGTECIEATLAFVEAEAGAWVRQIRYRRQSHGNRLAAFERLAECARLRRLFAVKRTNEGKADLEV